MKQLAALYSDESGATIVEYCIVVAFIAAVCIGVLTIFGQNVHNNYTAIATGV